MIVAFTGMPGSGKSEAAAIAKEKGFRVLRMGDLVEAMARDEGLPVGEVADREREIHGKGIWAERILELLDGGGQGAQKAQGRPGAQGGQGAQKAQKAQKAQGAIDGLRGSSELRVFKERCRDFYLVAIWASPLERRRRLIRRGRFDLEELEKRDERELSWGLGDSIALADFMIVNGGSLEEFKEEVSNLLDSLLNLGSA
jgi:dephospho-CoA kinase